MFSVITYKLSENLCAGQAKISMNENFMYFSKVSKVCFFCKRIELNFNSVFPTLTPTTRCSTTSWTSLASGTTGDRECLNLPSPGKILNL